MGRRGTYPGVEDNGGQLRVTFTLAGERCREPLGWDPTPANWKRAAALRSEIRSRIRAGTFVYAEYFPHSRRAAHGAKTFGMAAQDWLSLQTELALSTQKGYEKVLNTYWMPQLGKLALREITPGAVLRALADAKFKSVKTRNNAISPLKMVFEYAVGERWLAESPAADVEFKRPRPVVPDPFTPQEVAAILGWLDEHAAPQDANYFRFAFYSGLRVSELHGLQWAKVDFKRRVVRVDEARVMKRAKGTKTVETRDVELPPPAMAALEAQRKFTHLAYQHVFLDPLTGEPYVGDKPPRLVLQRALKALKMRVRGAKQTRHTYATMGIMAGNKPAWVAKQLGHSVQMLFKHYARWLEEADSGRELAKLEHFLGQSLGQSGVK